MKSPTKDEQFYPTSVQEWRDWLQKNHIDKQSVWVVCYKRNSNKPTISWSEGVDQALCFGWIDSTRKSLTEESFIQFYTKRKPTSVWSKINKEKIALLQSQNLIAPAGLACVEIAKKNGNWTILDEVEELIIPDDLEQAFLLFPGSKDYFIGLSKSVRKQFLHWIVVAKRIETRQNRINEIVQAASKATKPKQFR